MSQRYIGGLIYNPPGGFSGYFDGSGDWLNLTGTNFNVGTGAFTLEGWIYMSSYQYSGIVSSWNSTGTGIGFFLGVDNTGRPQFSIGNAGGGSDTTITGSSALPLNTWIYLAATKAAGSGGAMTLFVNGSSVATATTTLSVDRTATVIGRYYQDVNNYYLTGYISNVRVSNIVRTIVTPTGAFTNDANTLFLSCAYPTFRDGSSNNFTITVNGNTAVSTQNPFPQTQLPNPALGNQGNGVYSMSQYQALRSQNLWPAIDPYFDYVTLMLHGNGTNGAQNNTFLDSSTNNFTITRNGNTTQGTFTPYGPNWSNYFNGTDAWLSIGSNAAFGMGTGDCTIECWYYPLNSTSGNQVLVDLRTTNTAIPFALGVANGTGAPYAYNGTAYSGGVVANNAWNHIAFVRSGSGTNNCKLYLNGSQVAQFTDTNNWGSAQTCAIGRNTAFGGEFAFGYISNVRIVKGTAVYTSAFTPPAAPLTAIANTSLLTCADNRYIDESSNNFSITGNGSANIQRFSPFNPTAPYTPATIGGSGYFDGSGDFLSAPDSSQYVIGSNDACLELWAYTVSSSNCSFGGQNPGGSSSGFRVLQFGSKYQVTWNNDSLRDTGVIVKTREWVHLAYTKTGTRFRVFINGALALVFDDSSPGSDANSPYVIGADETTGELAVFGYISDYRLVNGSIPSSYQTSSTTVGAQIFTPPTAPLTAISNTSLLCNFTNAGIIDNAMMNDLETVGNAQISTSVSKFGGGSLAFDGSGDYLLNRSSPSAQFPGNFTVEAWIYPLAAGNGAIFDTRTSDATATGFYFGLYTGSNTLLFFTGGAVAISGGTAPVNTWTHIALVRFGSAVTIYVNGQSVGTATSSANFSDGNVFIGSSTPVSGSSANSFNGYIDDLRVTQAYARYTGNFTPQRSQWQDQ